MDKNLELLLGRGADCVGGDIIFKGKSMGRLRNGVFDMSADGEIEVNTIDANGNGVDDEAGRFNRRPARVAKGKQAAIEAPVVEQAPVESLDDLLAD